MAGEAKKSDQKKVSRLIDLNNGFSASQNETDDDAGSYIDNLKMSDGETMAKHQAEYDKDPEQANDNFQKSELGQSMADRQKAYDENKKAYDENPEEKRKEFENSGLGKSLSDAGLGGDWSKQSSVKQDENEDVGSGGGENDKNKVADENLNKIQENSEENEEANESSYDDNGNSDKQKQGNDKNKGNDGEAKKDADIDVEGIKNAADDMGNWSGVANAAVVSLGWSEIGRVLLRIICAQVPMLGQMGQKFPKLSFYFKPITFSNWLDIAQLIIWLLLVIIWGLFLVGLFILVFTAVYCSQPENYIQCGIAAVKAMT